MNFIKTSFLSGVSTGIGLLARLLSFKIIAEFLGPTGMYYIGQLRDFLKYGNVLSTYGIENGITKYTSDFENSKNNIDKILSTGFRINFFGSLITSIIILILEFPFGFISEFLKNEQIFENGPYLLIILISIFSFSFHTLFLAIINGLKKIKLWVLINIISNIISALILVLFVLSFEKKIHGALYAILLSQILTFIINLVMVYIYKPFKFSSLLSKFSFNFFKKLSNFSLMFFVGSFSIVTATIVVRSSLADTSLPIIGNLFDVPWSKENAKIYAGSWDAMWKISGMYLLFLIMTFKFYLIPTFSKLNNKKLKKEVFKIWKFITPLIIVITMSIYILDDFIINVLISKDFYLIKEILLFHLLGDIIKINCWVLGNIMVVKKQTINFSIFQLEWVIVFLSLSFIFVDENMLNFGFVGISYAYFITYIIHFTLLNLYFRKLLWIKK
tara:strand:- start:280 stop:1611 length:1332 start_codon:yes stop_codon:yes gene_type:complete